MLVVLACRCGGVREKACKFLKDNGDPNWLNEPIYGGVEECKKFVENLPESADGPDHKEPLLGVIEHAGSFLIILGYTNNCLVWTDVYSGNAKAVVDARVIIEQFA